MYSSSANPGTSANQLNANSGGLNSLELISHAQAIYGNMRDKAVESRQLSGIASAVGEIGKSMMQSVKTAQSNGAKVIVCEEGGRVELDVKKVIKMLKESTNFLHNFSKQLNFHAKAYESQLKSHDHLMSGFLSWLPLHARVGTCEKQANGWMRQQKNYLQSNMAKIEDAEMDVVGLQQMLGIETSQSPLKPAVEQLVQNLDSRLGV